MDASKFISVTKDRDWVGQAAVPSKQWKCGYCNREVGSSRGWQVSNPQGHVMYIRLCSYCNGPTLFLQGDAEYSPGPLPGHPVEHLPPEIESLFAEARTATSAGAYTAAVLTCRKILMHIAVEKGADTNKNFLEYVTYLIDKGYHQTARTGLTTSVPEATRLITRSP